MYQVEVHWAPAHELIASLATYLSAKHYKLSALGAAWATMVKKQLDPALVADLANMKDGHLGAIFHLLVTHCPEPGTPERFVEWLSTLPPGYLYENIAPLLLEGALPMPKDLGQSLAYHADLLRRWNEQYFGKIDPSIMADLAAEAESRRARLASQSPQEAVEEATNGIVLDPVPGLERILLTPSYHLRPLNTFQRFRGLGIYIYGAPDAPAAPGEIDARLMRILRALTDESRIKILRFVADQSRSFMEIVNHTGLALSTVHHHLVALRAAGLVRVHEVSPGPGTGQNYARYSFRPAAVEGLGPRLVELIQGGLR